MINQSLDMDTYIKKRLTEIIDDDERSFAREVILKGLLPALKAVDERYQSLEDRVMREVEVESSRFIVRTMVVRQKDYDPTNYAWFPVCEQDISEEDKTYKRIYFRGNEMEKHAFEAKQYLNAADAEGNLYRVGIRRAEGYLKAVESLYHLFVYNRVPWSTVNTGDLERFYELYPLDPEETENIKDWKILYDEWEDRIDRDYIPLWNVEKFYFCCMKFMMPSLDGKYYEHELDLEQYGTDSGYMVENNEDILSIRYEKNKIIMTSQKETFENWCAYRFGRKMDMDSYGYDHRILGNQKKESFADHLVARYGQGIHTKTELVRIVEGLGVEEYIQLEDCRIKDKESERSFPADMNWFIKEEVFPMETRRVLELTFVRRKDGCAEAYYAEDMLRYVVSQIQLFLDEYKCVGVFA